MQCTSHRVSNEFYLFGLVEGAGPAGAAVHAAVPDTAPEHRPVAARLQPPLADSPTLRTPPVPSRPATVRPQAVRGPPR